ncbi:WhiB family transcriptional regulator [Demequina sp. SO4-18]|uniref:WhiB family transcriptional regulator n=1 Tax=Demequina sp. SO4-18 TaxID=3401026 RepID=UPI003B5A30AA
MRFDHHAPAGPDSERWDENAVCKDSEDPDIWYPNPTDKPAVEKAKALCGLCPSGDACFAGALERREKFGVWGGVLFDKGTSRQGGKSSKRLRDQRRYFVAKLEREARRDAASVRKPRPRRKTVTEPDPAADLERVAELEGLIEEQRAELDAAVLQAQS